MIYNQAAGNFFRCPDLKELYSSKYDDHMTRWRTICAIDKAGNIASMLVGANPPIGHVLDVGCGTEAVLSSVAEKKIGTSFTGIEIGALCEAAPLLGL